MNCKNFHQDSQSKPFLLYHSTPKLTVLGIHQTLSSISHSFRPWFPFFVWGSRSHHFHAPWFPWNNCPHSYWILFYNTMWRRLFYPLCCLKLMVYVYMVLQFLNSSISTSTCQCLPSVLSQSWIDLKNLRIQLWVYCLSKSSSQLDQPHSYS